MENLKYVISEKSAQEFLSKDNYEKLLEEYHQTFMKIYGADLVDSFLRVAKLSTLNRKRREKVKGYSTNYEQAEKALADVSTDANLKSLFVYVKDDELIGGGRIKERDNSEVTVPDLAIFAGDEKLNREVWTKTIEFLEEYYKNRGNTRIYVEIPSGDPVLLGYGANLGFTESTIDGPNTAYYTYLIEKELERTKDAQFGNHRK